MCWTVISIDEHFSGKTLLESECAAIEDKVARARSDVEKAQVKLTAVQPAEVSGEGQAEAEAECDRALQKLEELIQEQQELSERCESMDAVEAEESLYNALIPKHFGCLITNEPRFERRNGSNTYFVMDCLPTDPANLLSLLNDLRVLDHLNGLEPQLGKINSLGNGHSSKQEWVRHKDAFCGLDIQHFGVSVTRIYSSGQVPVLPNVVYLLCAAVNHAVGITGVTLTPGGTSKSIHSENWILKQTDDTLFKLDGKLEAALRNEKDETPSSLRKKVGRQLVDTWIAISERHNTEVDRQGQERRAAAKSKKKKSKGAQDPIIGRLHEDPRSDMDWELLKNSGDVGTSKKTKKTQKNDRNNFGSTGHIVDAVDLFLIQDMPPCEEHCQRSLKCFEYYYTVAGVRATKNWCYFSTKNIYQ